MACKVARTLLRPLFSSMSTAPEVHFTHSGRTGLITLDRPAALNTLNTDMVTLITTQLQEWRENDNVEVVCVEGSGSKAFCAGGDVLSITKDVDNPRTAVSFFRKEFQMNHLIGTYPKPYVAIIHGITMGGGVGLSVHGKYRVATEKSLYAMPETAIGYFPDVGATYFLSRLTYPYGMFLGLTGYRLKGLDLKHLGIATHYTSSVKLADLKADILASDQNSIQNVLDKYEDVTNVPFSLHAHANTIEGCFSAKSVPEIIDRLKSDNSDFAQKLIKTMGRLSPRSLVITHKLLSLAPNLTFEDCFRTELNAAHEIVVSGEFTEGVRALLVDKDNSPVWKPAKLEDVTEDMITRYFTLNTEPWEPLPC